MISVIVPVYNPGSSLTNCLTSIINQTYKDLEIICINDGSTDDSLSVLSDFAKRDSRITVISQTNLGVSAARNKGLELANGEYVSFIDSDDELDTSMYERLLSLKDTPEGKNCSIFHCGYRRIRIDGTTADINGTEQIYVHTQTEALTHFLEGSLFNVGLWNKIFERNLFEGLRFDTELKINEDVLVCFDAFLKSEHSIYYDAPLYHYIEHSTSTCNTTNHLNRCLDVVTVSKRIYDKCKSSPLAQAAGTRYYDSLCGAYRAYINENISHSKKARDEIAQEVIIIQKMIPNLSFKRKFNFVFMRTVPRVYKAVYKIYDSIRVPNWDVN